MGTKDTTKTFNSITDFSRGDAHLENIDVGPQGDLPHGQASIKGDRWKHQRIGFAEAPVLKVFENAPDPAYELCTEDNETCVLFLSNTENFVQDGNIWIEDNDTSREAIILSINENVSIVVTPDLPSFYMNKNLSVSALKDIKIVPTDEVTVGDLVEVGNDIFTIHAYDGDTGSDDWDTIQIRKFSKPLKKDNVLSIINTSNWTRDEKNPIMELQRKNYWDYAGQNVKTPEIKLSADIEKDSKDKIVSKKNGAWITAERENNSSQISFVLSKDKDDIYNWTDFLGDKNDDRPNPILRHSHYMDRFDVENYADTDEMKLLWNAEDGTDVELTRDLVELTSWMDISYTDNGEVWGLMPIPINGDVRSNGSNLLSFAYRGMGINTAGTLEVRLLAADGTTLTASLFTKDETPNYEISLQEDDWATYTYDISAWAGRKYITAVIFVINGVGSGSISVDDITPFMPSRNDEIVEDPTIIAGKEETGELNGLYACYYTMRERPRQALTANALLDGSGYGDVYVGSNADFDIGDIVVIYDRDNFEIGKVRSKVGDFQVVIEHVAYSEDSTAEFENDYDIAKQARLANNTYRINQIGGAYTSDADDLSQWIKYPNNESPAAILDVGATGLWDETSVKQPCVRMLGGVAYMAYVGTNASGESQIGMASSTDFVTFTKNPYNPLINEGSGGADFDKDGCFHPDLFMLYNKVIINYTGKSGTDLKIGSAYYENNFHINYTTFHVTMLVFPTGADGLPTETRTLYDQGNFRIDVHEDNTLTAHCWVKGKEISTKRDDNAFIDNGFGTTLVHDHWNLVVAQYLEGQLSINVVRMTPEFYGHKAGGAAFFDRSAWVLYEDAKPGDTTVKLAKFSPNNASGVEYDFSLAPAHTTYDWLEPPKDFTPTGQDIMFYGNGHKSNDGGSTYVDNNERFFQVNRITAVSEIGATQIYNCTLLNPIGTWGFSSTSLSDPDPKDDGSILKQGVMLAQGTEVAQYNAAELVIIDRELVMLEESTAANHYIFKGCSDIWTKNIYEGTRGSKSGGYWWKIIEGDIDREDHYTTVTEERYKTLEPEWQGGWTWVPYAFDPRPTLDPSHSKIPVIGNNQDYSQAWDLGYIGHVDVAHDYLMNNAQTEKYTDLSQSPFPIYITYGGLIELYNQMINNSGTDKPQWHEFDLSLLGAEPDPHNIISRWVLGGTPPADGWDGTKFIDGNDPDNGNHLYLVDGAATQASGYLGRTMYMTSKRGDGATCLFFKDSFKKLQAGSAQFSGSGAGWDSSDVSGSHLFKFNNKYRLAYTGKGKKAYEDEGSIVADLYETSLRSLVEEGVDFEGTFEIPAIDCEVTLYMSWQKKSNWIEMWTSNGATGTVTLSDSFNISHGEAEQGYGINDYKYFVRWKLVFQSNGERDKSPIMQSFQVDYTEPDYPANSNVTQEFLDAQDYMDGWRRPVFKVVLWDSTNNLDIDITDRVVENGITNLTYDIPIDLETIADIIASDVTIIVENTDLYFSQLYDGSNPDISLTPSIFYDRTYLQDEIRIYSGFKTTNSDLEASPYDAGEFEVTGRFLINRVRIMTTTTAHIECRSLLRVAVDTDIGEQVDGEDDPLVFNGKVKDIIESLLINENVNNCVNRSSEDKVIGAGINTENVFIEDFDREFGHIVVNSSTVGEIIQQIAKACDGIVYTNNQGDVYFKTWANMTVGIYDISNNVNLKHAQFTGQDYDRLIKKANIGGPGLVQGTSESASLSLLGLGRDVGFTNLYLHKQAWADSLASKAILRYGIGESDLVIRTVYLPSVNILDTIIVTEPISGVDYEFLVHSIIKNVTTYQDEYWLVSNLAAIEEEEGEIDVMTDRVTEIRDVSTHEAIRELNINTKILIKHFESMTGDVFTIADIEEEVEEY